jgi:hypothetical protein
LRNETNRSEHAKDNSPDATANLRPQVHH